ncbi:MAG TPA: EVE domain-containing protein [Thermomicrobiales bacterium]|nr:EVE domain-containing protein [Thermomicrobiales bacterium]
MSESSPSYWIVVSSVDNWQTTKERGFTIQGIKSRHRKKAEQMKPGDKIVYYCTGVKAFAGVATITSPYFESNELIWKSTNTKREGEEYPFRVYIEKDLALDESAFVPAEPIARQMTYASKWPAEHWTLAFQGNVHLVPKEDYTLIRGAIEAAAN